MKCFNDVKWLWVGLAVVGIMSAPLFSAEKIDQADPNVEEEDIVLTQVDEGMSKLISVDFRETPIEDVLRSIARQAGVDIIKSPDVVGMVTATLTNIPLDEALTNLLSAHGYGFTATDNMILVMPKSQIMAEKRRKVNRVYRINYAEITEVYASLREFVSPEGEVAFNLGTSNLIVSDVESKMEAIDNFIKEVDRETPQVLIEARIYDITSKDALDFGVNWNAGKNTIYPGGIGNVGVRPIGDTNPFTTGAFAGQVDAADGLLGAFRFGWLKDNLDIDAVIRAEDQEANAKLLANPSILTLDNQMAMIQIISEIPYQELTQTSEGGNIGSTEFREVGVILEVTPHVTRNEQIRLHIRPEFSMATGAVQVGGFVVDSPQPVVDTRRADTITLIKSGDTVVIGGLKESMLTQQINKIPLLGDLPLVGWIFKFEGEEEVFSELLLFITPRIVNDTALSIVQKERLSETNFSLTPRTKTLRQRNKGLRRKHIIKK